MKKAFAVFALGLTALIAAVVVFGRRSGSESAASAEVKPPKPGMVPSVAPATAAAAPSVRPSVASVPVFGPKPSARHGNVSASHQAPRAKAALLALFAVKPGEMPPELPPLTMEERNLLPVIIETELTDADGCDAQAVRREYRLFMDFGGIHDNFLYAYRRKLLKQHQSRSDARARQ